MSKGNQLAKWVLPDVIDPAGRICYLVPVPDDMQHRAAFFGAMLDLASAYKWQDDPDHKAKDVALVWRAIVDDLIQQDCEAAVFDVRQNTEEPCELDKSSDGGATWAPFADLTLCPPLLRYDGGILQIRRGGTWVPADGGGGYDERYDGTYDPPWPSGSVPPGQSGNCLAAENIVSFLETSLTQVKQGLDIGTPVSTSMGIVAGTIGFLGLISAGVFAAVGLIIAGLLAALGSAGINDILTDGTLDTLKCILFCHLELDGSCTAAEFNDIYDQVGTDITGLKGQVIQNWLNGFGPVGLSRQGKVAAITSADCTDCTECFTIHVEYADYHGGPAIGSGPTDLLLDTEYTAIGSLSGGGCAIFMLFDQCVKLEIVSSTDYVRFPTGSSYFNYLYNDCDGAVTVYTADDRGDWPTSWDDTICVTKMGGISYSATLSITFKLTAIC